jgi:transposase
MPRADRITAVIGFQKYRVVGFKRISKQRIELSIDLRDRGWKCPRCGHRLRWYYDRDVAVLRDLDLSRHRTVLHVWRYRVQCDGCGVLQVPLGIARPRARMTRRFERWLFILTRTMPVSEAAELTGIDWKTVKAAEIRYSVGLLRKRNLEGIEGLGIDEVSERKGHRYITLITDIAKRRVIWVVRGRDRKALRAFFRWFGKRRMRKLKRFVIDMHQPYEDEIRAQCPRAKIIYDHFHLSKLLHRALDDLRRRVQSELPKERRVYLKRSRYVLLKRPENLTPNQRVRLRQLMRANTLINRAYILKEDFRAVFEEQDPHRARAALQDWKARVKESRIPEFMEVLKTFNRRRYGIQNFMHHRLTNGLSEGFNNVVKTIKKLAYGFHDWTYFAKEILRQCGGVERQRLH